MKTLESQEGRFRFGQNWLSFVETISDENIAEAEKSLKDFLDVDTLEGKSFVDVGSGSGLFSLAASRLGAKVVAFDYDADSVECTRRLLQKRAKDTADWRVSQGSILDKDFVSSLGKFDVVYSFGVLHHTGDMAQAMENLDQLAKDQAKVYIALYNDQGFISHIWRTIKRTYCSSPLGKVAMTSVFYPLFFLAGLSIDLVKVRDPRRRYKDHIKMRGMSLVHDWKDWLGGYPYETATRRWVEDFYEPFQYKIEKFELNGHGFGCNHYVFSKNKISTNSQNN